MSGPPIVCRFSYIGQTVCQGVIHYSASLVRLFCLLHHASEKTHSERNTRPAMPSIRPNKRARRGRLRPDNVPIVTPTIEPESADSRQAPEALGTVSVDVGAITATISSVLSKAIKSAFAPENLASILSGPAQQKQQVVTQDASGVVKTRQDKIYFTQLSFTGHLD